MGRNPAPVNKVVGDWSENISPSSAGTCAGMTQSTSGGTTELYSMITTAGRQLTTLAHTCPCDSEGGCSSEGGQGAGRNYQKDMDDMMPERKKHVAAKRQTPSSNAASAWCGHEHFVSYLEIQPVDAYGKKPETPRHPKLIKHLLDVFCRDYLAVKAYLEIFLAVVKHESPPSPAIQSLA
mmetsp:Transcript_33756/g.85336  ORF Transcript_33756/g.85336 Transcript_33756/m.85336 type:complete len:180 (-) Transcript_33756:158-697(-)